MEFDVDPVLTVCEGLARRAAEHSRGQKALRGWAAVVRLEVEDGDGCHLHIENGGMSARPGPGPEPTVTLRGSGDALREVLSGAIDATHLLASGQMEVSGHYYDMINLGRVAAAVRERNPA